MITKKNRVKASAKIDQRLGCDSSRRAKSAIEQVKAHSLIAFVTTQGGKVQRRLAKRMISLQSTGVSNYGLFNRMGFSLQPYTFYIESYVALMPILGPLGRFMLESYASSQGTL
jgi:hypothetical protein